jgi:hypothetical protein
VLASSSTEHNNQASGPTPRASEGHRSRPSTCSSRRLTGDQFNLHEKGFTQDVWRVKLEGLLLQWLRSVERAVQVQQRAQFAARLSSKVEVAAMEACLAGDGSRLLSQPEEEIVTAVLDAWTTRSPSIMVSIPARFTNSCQRRPLPWTRVRRWIFLTWSFSTWISTRSPACEAR